MTFIEIISSSLCMCVFLLGLYELSKTGMSEREAECLERLNFC